ncbi:hypothetical protein DE146DRAFT_634392 [Phaeosphaeria sp. MPI-PUGE-AT-0046c]|nr:hypothetical protein DE146DRAFT_634392 [Phaeosphaeria sp. MPI-PUGE-AT-0046c]
MELSGEYMHKLGTTRMFSDFTFKVEGGAGHKVHKLILGAHSPVFERFFQRHEKEADLFELFPDADYDEFTKLAIRESMIDIFAYCYFGRYHNTKAGDFDVRVLSHLLTLSLAGHLEMPGLVGHSHVHFVAAFVDFDSSSSPEQIQLALTKCFSAEVLEEKGFSELARHILQDVAFEGFAEQVKKLKQDGKFKEAFDFMEAVPMAAAKLYSCRPLYEHEHEESVVEEREASITQRGEGLNETLVKAVQNMD